MSGMKTVPDPLLPPFASLPAIFEFFNARQRKDPAPPIR